MDSNASNALWGSDAWRSRLVTASRHRRKMQLTETSAWTGFDPRVRPKSGREWKTLLFLAAACGMDDIVEIALDRGASAVKPFSRSWIGVSRGRLLRRCSQEAAYRWGRIPGKQTDEVYIHTPIQSAVAGGCSRCIGRLAEAGSDLEEVIAWLTSLQVNVPRVHSGLAIGEYLVSRPESVRRNSDLIEWLSSVPGWLERRRRAHRLGVTQQQALLTLHRRIDRLLAAWSKDYPLSSETLAELL